jgi:prevent-host-death family protein
MSTVGTVGSYEAKTHLPALLERVQAGERITITKHGVPVAILVPAGKQAKKDTREVIAQLKAFGRGRKLPEGVTVRDLIAEGRFGLEEPDHTSAATRERIRRIEARALRELQHPRRPA